MKISVRDAYEQDMKDLYASAGGSKIISIRKLQNGWFRLRSAAFAGGDGYKVRGNYMLWINDDIATVKLVKQAEPEVQRGPKVGSRSRAWVLTEKGYRACKQMYLDGVRFEFPWREE